MESRWWHPMGDQYLVDALSSDDAFALGVKAEVEVQRKRSRQVAAMIGDKL